MDYEQCYYCTAELHNFCLTGNDVCCCHAIAAETAAAPATNLFSSPPVTPTKVIKDVDLVKRRVGAPKKDPALMKDPISAGRARAERLYPIEKGVTPCDWINLKNAGGGVVPILGCRDGKAVAVHHGPDKSVLRNEPENTHRICIFCHNRWHVANDKYYGSNGAADRPEAGANWLPLQEYKPHDPVTKWTEEDKLTDDFIRAASPRRNLGGKAKRNGEFTEPSDDVVIGEERNTKEVLEATVSGASLSD